MSELMQQPVVLGALAVAAALITLLVGWLLSRRSTKAWESVLSAEETGDASRVREPPPGSGSASTGQGMGGGPSDRPSVLGRLALGLSKTKSRMISRVDDLFRGRKLVDEDLWAQLEELLLTSDVGIRPTTRLLESMRERAAREELQDPSRLREILRESVHAVLSKGAGVLAEVRPGSPLVIMVVGVNGAGKTTTIGKLAARYTAEGRSVLIAAGDTFRAAAIEQVVVWGKRAGAEIVRHEAGSDPAAVAHDAVTAGLARGVDVVICDTAGRLHTKSNLMIELQKVNRVIAKVLPGAPQEVLLVLDSTNGQNAIAQAREFASAVGVTGIVLTKLDGTARGGVIIGIADELSIPVKLIGIGEAIEDLRDFEADAFVEALFGDTAGGLGRGSNSARAAAEDVERGITVEPLEDA